MQQGSSSLSVSSDFYDRYIENYVSYPFPTCATGVPTIVRSGLPGILGKQLELGAQGLPLPTGEVRHPIYLEGDRQDSANPICFACQPVSFVSSAGVRNSALVSARALPATSTALDRLTLIPASPRAAFASSGGHAQPAARTSTTYTIEG